MTYPEPLDLPDDTLKALGSFWSATERDPLTRNLISARLLQDRFILGLLDDYRNSYSRQKCPLLRRQEAILVKLRESSRSSTDSLYQYGDTTLFYDGSINYGQVNKNVFVWSLPPGLVDISAIVDRLDHSTVSWMGGLDYTVVDSKLRFIDNPFNKPGVPINEVLVDGEVVDRELWVWFSGCSFDLDYIYKFFGYAVGLPTKSTDNAKRAVNSIYDAITKTNVHSNTLAMLSSITDSGFAREDGETVEHVFADTSHLWIVTNLQTYAGSLNAEATVVEGDILTQGQPLTDAVSYFSLHRGTLPVEIPVLCVQNEWLDVAPPNPVLLNNDAVSLTATPNLTTGFLEVRFPFSVDDDWFWEEVRAREVAQGISLAKLMLGLTADDPEPVAGQMPATIQPQAWFVQNFLRNAVLIIIHTSKLGDQALQLSALNRLRYSSAPHIWYIVLIISDVDLPAYELPPSTASTLDISVVEVDPYELPPVIITAEATGVSCR